MTTVDTANELREALTHFETSLQTPIVSGEQASWLEDARQALDRVVQAMSENSHRHTEMLNTILHEDGELLGRVEDLRQLDSRVTSQLNSLKAKARQLCERATAVQPDELKLEKQVRDLINQGLTFVIAARKLDTGVTTWYAEATKHGNGHRSDCPHGENPDGTCKDIVQEASEESFPASDPPSRTPITSTGPSSPHVVNSSRQVTP